MQVSHGGRAQEPAPESNTPGAPVVAVRRRTIDTVLIGFGAVCVAVLATAGGLLTWGHTFRHRLCARRVASPRWRPRRRCRGRGLRERFAVAGIAAIVCFSAAGVLLVLVVLGIVHRVQGPPELPLARADGAEDRRRTFGPAPASPKGAS